MINKNEEIVEFEEINNENKEPEKILVEADRLTKLLQECKKGDEARECLIKILKAYEVLETDGVVKILSKIMDSEDISMFSLAAPIGRIIPKVKKYGENEDITNVFNFEFFETAKKAAKS